MEEILDETDDHGELPSTAAADHAAEHSGKQKQEPAMLQFSGVGGMRAQVTVHSPVFPESSSGIAKGGAGSGHIVPYQWAPATRHPSFSPQCSQVP